jgi:hypothetical protein
MRATLLAGVLVVVDLREGRAGDHVAGSALELTTELKKFQKLKRIFFIQLVTALSMTSSFLFLKCRIKKLQY